MPTYTTTYSLGKPVVGADEDAWGDTLNTSLDAIDDILDGTTPITGIDINSGTLDGVTIGGTTAGAGTFTTLTANTSITGTLATAAQPNVTSLGTLTSLTVSGDVSFGDNDKAIFGAGSDLQIYHDGSASYIIENGPGDLNIQSNGSNLNLLINGGENAFTAANNGAVTLYYDNAAKLATTSTGIDVTGEITADGLTVDATDTEAANSQLLKLRNSTTGEAVTIGLYAKADNGGDGNAGSITFDAGADGSSANNEIRFNADHQTDTNPALSIAGNGDISFYEDTGTTAKFFWDASAESLGLGATSFAGETLRMERSGDMILGLFSGAANGTYLNMGTTANRDIGQISYTQSTNHMSFRTNDAERMRIDSSGNVGIGVVPQAGGSTWQHVQFGGTGNLVSRISDSTVDAMFASNYYVNASNVDSYITTGAAARMFFNDNTISFDQAASGTAGTAITWSEAMRIDSSGNLLVGGTDTFPHDNAATSGTAIGASGYLSIARSGGISGYFNRMTSDGDIVQFRKDGTTVGSIGTKSGDLTIGTGDTAIRFEDGADHIIPFRVDTNVGRDAAVNLGDNLTRFKDLYLSGGVYLGGTGSANKLDDYEEGTWTPVVKGNTTAGTANYLYRDASYAKVGNMVHVSCTIFANSFTGTGDFRVSGLPFTYNGTAIFAAQWNNSPFATYSSDKQQVVGLGTAGTEIHFRASDRQYNVSHTQLQCQGGSATVGYLRLSGTYHV